MPEKRRLIESRPQSVGKRKGGRVQKVQIPNSKIQGKLKIQPSSPTNSCSLREKNRPALIPAFSPEEKGNDSAASIVGSGFSGFPTGGSWGGERFDRLG
jgi:hypothetical protein